MMNNLVPHDQIHPLIRAEAERIVVKITCPISTAVEAYMPMFETTMMHLGVLLLEERYELVSAILKVCDERALSGTAAREILTRVMPRKDHLQQWSFYNEKWYRLYVTNIYACGTVSEMLEVSRQQGRLL